MHMRIGLQPLTLLDSHVVALGIETMRNTFPAGGNLNMLAQTLDQYPLLDFITVCQTTYPDGLATWRSRMREVVGVMVGRVKRIQLGNELFITSAQGDNWTGTPREFAETFDVFVQEVYRADPSMIVVTPGLCSGCIEARSERAEDLLRLPRRYPEAPMEVDGHIYRGWQTAASHVEWAEEASGRAVIVTECAAYTAGGVMQLFATLSGAGATDVLYHALTLVATDTPPFQAQSLLDGGKESPRYWGVKTWTQTVKERCIPVSLADGLYYYKAGNVYVLWADSSRPVTIPIHTRRADRIDPIGGVSPLPVRQHEVRFMVGTEPCYVVER